jgi:hypothetical protein
MSFLDIHVIGCFANFAQIAQPPNGEPTAAEFNRFDHERYWQSVLGTPHRDQLAADWSGEGALGKAHTVWVLAELVRRYDHETHDLKLGAAGALLGCALKFRAWLYERPATNALMATAAWKAPWPRFAAAGLLEFDETLTWLEHQVAQRWMAEEGIAVLVGLAPELFGHQLLFWELIVRTAPH